LFPYTTLFRSLTGEGVGHEPALGSRIAMHLQRRAGTGEGEEGVQRVRLRGCSQRRGPSRGIPHMGAVFDSEEVVHGESGDAIPQVAVELLLGAEDELSGVRVQSIGPQHYVRSEERR